MQGMRRRSGELGDVSPESGVYPYARRESPWLRPRGARRARPAETRAARTRVSPAASTPARLEILQRALGALALVAFPATGAAYLTERVSVPIYLALAAFSLGALAFSLAPPHVVEPAWRRST